MYGDAFAAQEGPDVRSKSEGSKLCRDAILVDEDGKPCSVSLSPCSKVRVYDRRMKGGRSWMATGCRIKASVADCDVKGWEELKHSLRRCHSAAGFSRVRVTTN